MKLKFKTLLTQQYWSDLITAVKKSYPTAEWLDDTKAYTSMDELYTQFIDQYGERYIRYKPTEFSGYYRIIFKDETIGLYAKQQVYIAGEINIIADKYNRGSQSTNTGTNNTKTNQAFSTTPYDKTIGDDPALESAKEKILTLGNSDAQAQIQNINFVRDIANLLKLTNFSLHIKSYLSKFNVLFTNYETSATQQDPNETLYYLIKSVFGATAPITITDDDVKFLISIGFDGSNYATKTDISNVRDDFNALEKTVSEGFKNVNNALGNTALPSGQTTITGAIDYLDKKTPPTPDIYPQVKGIIKGGSNITITSNDTSKQITITATGGSGGKTYTGRDGVDVNNTTNIIGFTQDLNDTIGQIGTNSSDIRDLKTHLGDVSSLNTQAKVVVDAINEVNTNAGALTSLTTTDKTNLVDAINEVNAKQSGGKDWVQIQDQTNWTYDDVLKVWNANTPLTNGSYKIVLSISGGYTIYCDITTGILGTTGVYNIFTDTIFFIGIEYNSIKLYSKTIDTTTSPTPITSGSEIFTIYQWK